MLALLKVWFFTGVAVASKTCEMYEILEFDLEGKHDVWLSLINQAKVMIVVSIMWDRDWMTTLAYSEDTGVQLCYAPLSIRSQSTDRTSWNAVSLGLCGVSSYILSDAPLNNLMMSVRLCLYSRRSHSYLPSDWKLYYAACIIYYRLETQRKVWTRCWS
jgi:hypothetical protein